MLHKYTTGLVAVTFINLLAMPTMAVEFSGAVSNEIDCEYDSNSEWPWLDSRVCQAEIKPVILDDEGQVICSDSRADKDGDGWGWENGRSCVIDPNQPEEQSNTPSLEVVQEDLVVFEQDFESASVGPYLPETLNEQWDTPIWHLGFNEGRVKVVQDAVKGKAIEVLFPANEFGSSGAAAFLSDLSFGVAFERNFEELYVSYDVKFSKDFDFVRGGKLPGLCGYNLKQAPKDGCNTGGGFPTGHDGWSARGMWREDGILENYMYHADQFYQYGDDEYWDAKAVPGQWHTFQHRIVLNTVGEANGIVEAWFDGKKVLSSNNMLYRKTADIGINLFYFSTFYGGADPSWAPATDQTMYFDNFRIATTPIDTTANVTPIAASLTNSNAPAASDLSETDNSITTTAQPSQTTQSSEASSVTEADNAILESNIPEVAAAKAASESGGGAFYPWLLALLVLLRGRASRRAKI